MATVSRWLEHFLSESSGAAGAAAAAASPPPPPPPRPCRAVVVLLVVVVVSVGHPAHLTFWQLNPHTEKATVSLHARDNSGPEWPRRPRKVHGWHRDLCRALRFSTGLREGPAT